MGQVLEGAIVILAHFILPGGRTQPGVPKIASLPLVTTSRTICPEIAELVATLWVTFVTRFAFDCIHVDSCASNSSCR